MNAVDSACPDGFSWVKISGYNPEICSCQQLIRYPTYSKYGYGADYKFDLNCIEPVCEPDLILVNNNCCCQEPGWAAGKGVDAYKP